MIKKPTTKQLELIKFFQKQLSFWENTSDIDSLSHYTDIDEELGKLYTDSLSRPAEYDRIESITRLLYQTIRDTHE